METMKSVKTIDDLNDELDIVVENVLNRRINKPLGMQMIDSIVYRYREENVISDSQIKDARARADYVGGKKGRHFIELFLSVKYSYMIEKKISDMVYAILTKKGERVKIEEFGNADHGKVRFVNVDSEPDIKLTRNRIHWVMDIKCMRSQFFKFSDINMYAQKYNAGIIFKGKNDTKIYIHSPKAIFIYWKFFQDKPSNFPGIETRFNKSGFYVGGKGCAVQLQNMINKKFVEVYEI